MSQGHSVPLSALHSELTLLCIEIRADSQPPRNKAVDRLDAILSTRKSDIISCISDPLYTKDLNWVTLFNNAFDGIIKHSVKLDESKHMKSYTTLKNKNFTFSGVVSKIVDYALEAKSPIKCGRLIEAVSDGLENRSVCEYFSSLLFQIVERGIVATRGNLNGVKSSDLGKLLKQCFGTYDEEATNGQNLPLLRCINKILDLGTKYSLLCVELPSCLPYMRQICNNSTSDKSAQSEIIRLIYQYVCNVAADCHSEIASFLQTIMPSICGYYDFRMKPAIKEQLFELCAIFLSLHYPETDKFDPIVPIGAEEEWKTQLKQIFNLVKSEIKEKSRELNKDTAHAYGQSFLLLASLVSYLVFWNPIFETTSNETQRKIAKYATKYQGILDLSSNLSKLLNWGWFIILSECMSKYHKLIDVTDYQPMLQTFLQFQKAASSSSQIRSVAKACKILLEKELIFEGHSFINANYCNNQWKEITDNAVNQLLQKSLSSDDYQFIVRSLIEYKKIPNDSVLSLVKSFITNPSFRTDSCLQTLRVIVKHCRDIFINNSDVVRDLFNWLYPLTVRLDTKSIIHNKFTDPQLMANVVAFLIVENESMEDDFLSAIDETAKTEPTNHEIILNAIRFDCLERIVFIESRMTNSSDVRGIIPTRSKLIINENYFKVLLKAIDFDISTIAEKDATDLLNNSSKLEMLLALLSEFSKRGTFDRNDLCMSAVIKKTGFLLNSIELQLNQVNIQTMDITNVKDVLRKLRSIVEYLNSPNMDRIVGYSENEAIIQYLCKCLDLFSDENVMYDDEDLVYRRKLALESIKVLASCNISSLIFERINQFDINMYNANEVETILSIIEVFCQHKPEWYVAKWIVTNIQDICRRHHENSTLSLMLIKLLPAIAKYIKSYTEHTESISIILSSFLKKCYKRSYPPSFVNETLVTVRTIAKIYCESVEQDPFLQIYASTNKFITMPSKLIQYASVDCWSYLIDDRWLFEAVEMTPFSHMGLCDTLFDVVNSVEFNKQDVLYERQHPVIMQLLLAAFGLNYYLEERALSFLIEHGILEKRGADQRLKEIEGFLKRPMKSTLRHNLISVLNTWLENNETINGELRNPPWSPFVADEMEFLNENRKIIQFCALYSNYDMVRKISNRLNSNLQEDLESLRAICYAVLMPHFTDRSSGILIYGCHCKDLISSMQSYKLDVDLALLSNHSLWEVLYHLTKNVWDPKKFTKMFDFQMLWPKHDFIDYETFFVYITHLFTVKLNERPLHILDVLLKQMPLQLVHLLNAIRADFEEAYYVEIKQLCLFHYCLIVNCIVESLGKDFQRDKLCKVRGYFIRDAIHCLCNILKNKEENHSILQAVVHFLNHLCSALLPTHADFLETNLNLIVRTIIDLITRYPLMKITSRCFNLLQSLICQNDKLLAKTIAILDDFPADERFMELCETHEKIKYKKQTDCLLDEINYFLQVEDRGIAGFQNLRKCLADRKDELNTVCDFNNKSLEEIRGSSVFILLKLLLNSVKSRSAEIGTEAAKCLGELGPIDLTTIALFSDLEDTCYEKFSSFETAFEYFVSKVMYAIEHILLTGSHEKVILATDTCQQVVNSAAGKKCIVFTPLLQIFGDKFTSKLNSWKPNAEIKFLEILESTNQLSYVAWITAFTSEMYAGIDCSSFRKLAEIDEYLCKETFTAYIKLLLATNSDVHVKSIEKMVNSYFKEVYIALESNRKTAQPKAYTDKSTIKYFLNIVECIRIHNQTFDTIIAVNYLHIAKACVYCEAYFMAALCLELWALSEKTADKPLENDDYQSIAQKAFTSIGYVDALCGFLDPMNSRLDYLSLQNRWDAVLLEFDAGSSNSSAYETHLRQYGFYSLAANVDKNSQDFEVLWRLGNWDISNSDCRHSALDTQEDLERVFESNHYIALRSVKKMEEENVLTAVESARKAIVDILKIVSSECTQNIFKYITWLQMLQQIVDFCEIQFPKRDQAITIFKKCDELVKMEYGFFNYKELVMSQRITLYNIAGTRAERRIKENYTGENIVGENLLNLVKECKSAGNKNLAIRNIAKLKNMDISTELKIKVLIEDADINWKQDNTTMAKSILHHLVKNQTYAFCFKKVDALRLYGEYHAESNSESFETIYKKFFKASGKLLENFTLRKDDISKTFSNVLKDYQKYYHSSRKNIYRSIAKYADREYTQSNDYKNSENFQQRVRIMEENHNAMKEAKQGKSDEEKRACYFLTRNAGIDENEIKALEERRIEYLTLAIENYMLYCVLDDAIKSIEIFRIISLWFSNASVVNVLNFIKDNLENVPSYKFICVMTQITARLSGNGSKFDVVLQDLLFRCALEHPHHTLPYIFAVAHANMDASSSSIQNSRIDVANKLIDKLSGAGEVKEIIFEMRKASKALIEFANKDGKEYKNKSQVLTDNLRKLRDLSNVQCHTRDMPISVAKKYNITSIVKWNDKFSFVGGINAPKKIICLCSDGVERAQLIKGKDDLRQDAIMQQLFGIVNDMLIQDKNTRMRKLKILTYKVVPFSMRSGILEWCENTIPLGGYLTGQEKNGGAHKKYRPKDYTSDKCVKLLAEKHKNSLADRFKVYMEVCERFQPVFHHFFLENFLNPEIWFEKRLAYTNSVATTSIVGYILGLGDRHIQNILINQITAEVVHIDFGIAFEQGKVMPTPETVPFRLTRDIVAPFGVCDVEGIFRKSCERTMQVLRENQMVLMTVLEVLLYDPLYIWILKPTQSDNEKPECETNINEEKKNSIAQRALMRVKAKLMGTEETGCGMTSVEGQVQRLIKQAIDPRNLCLLFPGWNPHV